MEIMAFFQNFDFFPKKLIFLKHSLWLQFIHQYSGHKESFLPIGIFQTGSFFGGKMPFLKKVVKCKHKPMWNSTYEAKQARPCYTFNFLLRFFFENVFLLKREFRAMVDCYNMCQLHI